MEETKILVVEDEQKIADTLNVGLTENGYHVEVAYDGKIIAELSLHNTWKQLSGDPLPKDLFEDIIYQIKKHYESTDEQ